MFQVIHPPYKNNSCMLACLCFEIGICPWPDLSSLFQYSSPTPIVSLHLIPRIQYHPDIPVTLLTGSSWTWLQGFRPVKLQCSFSSLWNVEETSEELPNFSIGIDLLVLDLTSNKIKPKKTRKLYVSQICRKTSSSKFGSLTFKTFF